jgi:serine/threonine-protein kinase RsbW
MKLSCRWAKKRNCSLPIRSKKSPAVIREPKAINQIKTALVEACINATEHSLSPDRKIYQKFSVEADKIIVTISNRGLRLTDVKIEEIKPEAGRRGWGLKLMKTLMDEVKIEQVDDGTRTSMTKYLK